MMPTTFEYPTDLLLGVLRVGTVPAEVIACASTSLAEWFDPTPFCEHCTSHSVASVEWTETHYEQRPVLSQAALERGPEYDEFPVDKGPVYMCRDCAFSVITDKASLPELDRSQPLIVKVSAWWLKRDRAGGVG